LWGTFIRWQEGKMCANAVQTLVRDAPQILVERWIPIL